MGMYNVLAASSSTKSSGGSYEFILFAVAIFALVYFFMIRPQQRRRQQAAQQQNTIAPGARVRTTAGMYATVVEVDGDDVVLEVAPGIEVRFMKRAIMDVVSPADAVEDTYEADAEDSEDADAEQYGEDDAAGVEAEADESPVAEEDSRRLRRLRKGHRYQAGLTRANLPHRTHGKLRGRRQVAPPSRSAPHPWRALTGLIVIILVMLFSILGSATFSPGKWHQQFKVGLGLDLSSGTQVVLQGGHRGQQAAGRGRDAAGDQRLDLARQRHR